MIYSDWRLLEPLDNAWYRRTTERQMKGVRVVAVRDMRNGWGVVARGTVLTIEDKFGGLGLQADRCDCCGYAPRISRVEPYGVALLPESGVT